MSNGVIADSGSNGKDSSIEKDSGLASVLVIARFYDLHVDPEQIRHRFVTGKDPMGADDLVRTLTELGLKAKHITRSWSRLSKLPLPAIIELDDGRFCILGKVTDDEALIQVPGEGRSSTYSREEVEAQWKGGLILCTRRLADGETGKFGFRWFAAAVMKYRKLLREVVLASAFIQVFSLMTPLVFMIIIDKVLSNNSLSTLDVLIFALAVVALFEVVLTALRTYLMSHTTNRIDLELGVRLFKHLMSLPLAYFGARRVGDTVARIRELESVRQFITGSALTLVLDLFFTVVFLVVMFAFSPFLAMIVVISMPILFGVSFLTTPLLREKLDDKFARGAENQSFLVEAVSGIETLKGFSVEPQMQRQWEDRQAAYVKAAFGSSHLGSITNQVTGFLSKAVVVLLLYLGAKLVMTGELTVGQLIAFNMLASRVNAPILRIAQIWQEFQQMRVSMVRLADILDAPAEPTFRPGRSSLPSIDGSVQLENVLFRYRPDGPEVLGDVSFKVQPGEVVGVVGPSGSGKTTLVKLLQRLYVPERGRVLVDGIDLAMVDASWLRRQIGVVSQDSILFNRSVRDNIAFGRPDLDMEKTVAAASLAGAHEFILELAEGYDTIIGERGGQLSAGQRQRLAIARALATNPRLLLLDEATSALDYESERVIQANMHRICEGRTVFIVAHRLSTLRNVNRILTFSRGRLIEDADPGTLLERGGHFAKLQKIQEDSQHVLA